MELMLILLTAVLMCKEPAIFLLCSFSPVYVVLSLIFWITWGRLIQDKFYFPFLRNYCLFILCSSFKMYLYFQSTRELETKANVSVSKLLICLAPFAFNASGTEVINSTLRLISLNVRGLSNFKKRRMIYTWCKKKNIDIIFLQETQAQFKVAYYSFDGV